MEKKCPKQIDGDKGKTDPEMRAILSNKESRKSTLGTQGGLLPRLLVSCQSTELWSLCGLHSVSKILHFQFFFIIEYF